MKKIFGALMIAVCIGMAMPAQAQLHFGVKGGLNLSKASFSDVKENFKRIILQVSLSVRWRNSIFRLWD